MPSDFTSLLGMQLKNVAKLESILPLMPGSSAEMSSERLQLGIPIHGIDFVADFDGRVSTIFFHSGVMHGYKQFSGTLPSGISFRDSQTAVRQRLGQPSVSGGDETIQFLGKIAKWDRYDGQQFSLHIQYMDDEQSISLVSLMRPDSVPQ